MDRFPIRILADKTNVGTSTLRAWERRYGLLKPQRTPKGHRLYCEQDTQRVLKILDLLNDGHSLPAIADLLLSNESARILIQSEKESERTDSRASIWDEFIQATLNAVKDFNIERTDAIYNEASSIYPIDLVTDKLIHPCLTILGNAWKDYPKSGIAEEHFYTSWLKNRLGARFHHAYSQARGSRIICACLPGSNHEIGLMLFALSALNHGYRVLYFGADLPLSQLAYIQKRSAAKGIVLGAHIQMSSNINIDLAQLIPKLKTPVFIGGSNPYLDTELIEKAGGILLGSEAAIALRIFESHIPLYNSSHNFR